MGQGSLLFAQRTTLLTHFLLLNISCLFVAFLADEGLTPQSIKSYLAAVQNTQLSLGLPDPREHSSLPLLKRVQASISQVRLGWQQAAQVRLPIMSQVQRQVKVELERLSNYERVQFGPYPVWPFSVFSAWGNYFSHQGKLSTPNFTWHGEMSVDDPGHPQMIWVHLKQAKTDKQGQGVNVVPGRTDPRPTSPDSTLTTKLYCHKESSVTITWASNFIHVLCTVIIIVVTI